MLYGPLAFEVRKIILEPEIIIILNNIIRLLNESVHFFILMKFLVARVLRGGVSKPIETQVLPIIL